MLMLRIRTVTHEPASGAAKLAVQVKHFKPANVADPGVHIYRGCRFGLFVQLNIKLE